MKKIVALTAFLCAGIALCGCENKGNATVTDISADTSAVTLAASDSSITMEEAEQTAFADAGVSEADITHLKVSHNTEDGGNVFKVEFFDAENEYEYEISAETGNIVSKSIEPRSENAEDTSGTTTVSETETHPLDTTTVQPAVTESSTASGTANTYVSQTAMANTTASAAKKISEDDAKRTAFADAGISESDAEYVNVKSDRDDGRDVFDVEFYAGGVEYDYEIDAESGRILSFDKDAENIKIPAKSETSDSGKITEAKAKEIAFADAGIAESDAKRVKTEFDRDDGREIYDVEFYYNNMEYSYEINAADGSIIERDIDRD